MAHGFEIGRLYNRRGDIHMRFGGQQQGGIITPRAHPVVFIVTGEEGHRYAYMDRLRDDGVFEYSGEGHVGDMEFVRGNAAILNHAVEGKDLLLFRKERGALRYIGEWVYSGHRFQAGPDTKGNQRQAIVFELTRLEDLRDILESDAVTTTTSLDDLRQRAFEAAVNQPRQSRGSRNIYERSRDVRDYVVARSQGRCEGCNSPAPFIRPNGVPYLEPHHLRRLSDGGPDDPRFVIALCATCHRRVHCGADGEDYNKGLATKMAGIEPA